MAGQRMTINKWQQKIKSVLKGIPRMTLQGGGGTESEKETARGQEKGKSARCTEVAREDAVKKE